MWIGIICVLFVIFLFVKASEVKAERERDELTFASGCRRTNMYLEVEYTKLFMLKGNELKGAHARAANKLREEGYDAPCIPENAFTRAVVYRNLPLLRCIEHTFSADEILALGDDAQLLYDEIRHEADKESLRLAVQDRTWYGEYEEQWKRQYSFSFDSFVGHAVHVSTHKVEKKAFLAAIKGFVVWKTQDVADLHYSGQWNSLMVDNRLSAYGKLERNGKATCSIDEYVYGSPFPSDSKEFKRQCKEYGAVSGLINIGTMILHPSHGACLIKDWVWPKKGGPILYLCQKTSDGTVTYISSDDKRVTYQGSSFL